MRQTKPRLYGSHGLDQSGESRPPNVVFRAGGDPTSGMKWSILTSGCASFSCVQSTSRMISAAVFAKRTQPPGKSKLQKSLGQDFVARTWLETQERAGIGWYNRQRSAKASLAKGGRRSIDDQVRLGRAAALARSGDHSRAVDEAGQLSRFATVPNGERRSHAAPPLRKHPRQQATFCNH
jgi:hypothetical protein